MEKFHSLSFYQNFIKYITIEMDNNCWVLTNHGEILFSEGRVGGITNQRANEYQEIFNKKRLKKNKGYITVEAHHTYLNQKSIPTLEKLKHPDIIKFNYKNTLPILFEKNRYGLSYNVEYIENTKTTTISFMGMLQEKIDNIYQSCLSMNVDPLVLNPSYQYFASILRKQTNSKVKKEYLLFMESSTKLLTFVLIHNNNPIMKRSIEINDHLETETNNYFYYLKHYLMVPDIFVFFSRLDQNLELLIINAIQSYYYASFQKIQELLGELPCFREIQREVMIDFQDCFIAVGGVVLDESIKRKNKK